MSVGDGTEQFVKDGRPAMRETHCVLWHAQDWPPSQELQAALDRRGMTVYRHDQRATALAEVCRLRGTREGVGGRPAIIVFVEPERLLRPDELKEVMDRYAPSTACWQYRATGNPQLRAVTDQDVQRWRTLRPVAPPRVAASIKASSIWAGARPSRRAPIPPMPPMAPPVIVGPRLKLTDSSPNAIQLTEPKPGATKDAKPTTPHPISFVPAPSVVPERADRSASADPLAKPAPAADPKPEPGPTDPRLVLTEEELAMLFTGEKER